MRPEPNNEIDLLLRQLGRQNGIPVSEIDEQHLDADELNSYVANALPAKTRARYTEHLADCSSCRKMAAQLSAAEGVMAVQQPAAVVEPSGFKSFLASLFSPMVLRYAVPALGVIVIAVVGIVMMRQRQYEREGASVAQVSNNAEQNRSASESPKTLTAPTATPIPEPGPLAGVMADAPAPVTAEAPPPKATPAEESERESEAEKKAAPAAEQVNAARDATQPSEVAKVDSVETAAKKEKQQDAKATAPATVMAPGNAAPEPQRARTGPGAGTAGGVATGSNAPQSRQDFRRSRSDEIRALSSAETRSVAGRQFRKQGDVWIDVAWGSHQSTTVIERGTEQYRALIADEPEIHTIAENLKSEFIVIWKGRAYRVR